MIRLFQAFATTALLAFALPAHALDCKSADVAKDALSKAICANPELKKADQQMSEAYQALYRGRDKLEQRVITALQLSWLRDDRDAACGKAPESPQCIAAIRQRTVFLKSADGVGPANQGKLIFKGLYKPYKKPGDMKIEVSLYEFEMPDTAGKKAFNAAVDKLLKSAGEEVGNDDCDSCEVDASMAMPLQANNFISAPATYWSFTGGAHGGGYTTILNYHLDDEHPVAFNDLFIEYDASILAKACYDEVMRSGLELSEATIGADSGNPRPSNAFMDAFGGLSNWQFDGHSAEVNFGLYVLGPYAAGEQSCTLSYDLLKQHLATDAVLPVAAAADAQ